MNEDSPPNWRPKALEAADHFHEHLDACEQCRTRPFHLCPEGAKRLEKFSAECGASFPSPQPNLNKPIDT